ncbi:hypothetical protein [Roseisolibacter sp. H3M3-2]|uniref:hypothetical protein n=1 Tax=Roseisolibacter sp. H3M3-2 TaxID=3031323 RepID=UPI0023D9E260|nr:hypothetical protein [Roseisolibacter sp. H3M3-2]MDF1505810.1 hypothetical protein [Roseisolibacter sp. H3M3-2]
MRVDAADEPRGNSRGHHPRYSAADRRDVLEVLRDKGVELKPPYAALCIVWWLHERGHDAVTASDVKALFPSARDGLAAPLRNAADVLRRAREGGMLEALGDGWYRLTPLGKAVVAVLPDGAIVGALRVRRTAACATRSGAVRRAAMAGRAGR